MHTDPVADMLERTRNASLARLSRVVMPFSQLKKAIAAILKQEGFIEEFSEATDKNGFGTLEVSLRHDENRESVISHLKRWSTPGMRVYFKYEDLPRICSGLGVLILTTPQGVMTDKEARKRHVGGEALCAVW